MMTISFVFNLFQRLVDYFTHFVNRLNIFLGVFEVSFTINLNLKGLLFNWTRLLGVDWLYWLFYCLLQPNFLKFGPVIAKLLYFT